MITRVCAAIVQGDDILTVFHPHDGRSCWRLPGNGVEAGETPQHAVVRQELASCRTESERLRKSRAVLETRDKQPPKELPSPSTTSLDERLHPAKLRNSSAGHDINQKRFMERAGVSLVLYFERLPDCLEELPFVDPHNVPPFPHHPEWGTRPSGNFFDFFRGTDDEQAFWAYAAEDFEAFEYHRFDCGPPEDAPKALRIS